VGATRILPVLMRILISLLLPELKKKALNEGSPTTLQILLI
jgi:hypothetical protein